MKGMSVVQIRLFFSFDHEGVTYPCALVEWFKTYRRSLDVETGMWKVRLEYKNSIHVTSVVHLDTILRGAHLLPVFGKEFLPVDFDPAYTLDALHAYYINKYADHHSHEITCVRGHCKHGRDESFFAMAVGFTDFYLQIFNMYIFFMKSYESSEFTKRLVYYPGS